jgi:ABC-type multidrug transport system fused ATPase/permease subunit
MKRNRRRLPVPQHEFLFVPQAFNLFTDTTLDGDRIARERAEADRARRAAESAQACLFTSQKSK